MTDLGPLPPCPSRKRGAHAIETVLVNETTGDVTYHCHRCGMVRRVPGETPVDDLTADEIEARIFGRRP